MENYLEILSANPNGVLATQDGATVKTRVFQFVFAEGKKFYFTTSNKKPTWRQMQANPNVSFCVHSPDFSVVLSINGRVGVSGDNSLKIRALEENALIKSVYGTPENPEFELIYIDATEAVTFTFTEGEKITKF